MFAGMLVLGFVTAAAAQEAAIQVEHSWARASAGKLGAGESFPLTLTFEHAGKIDVTVAVEKAGSTGEMPGMKN